MELSVVPKINCKKCGNTGFVSAEKGVMRCGCVVERVVRQTLPVRFHGARVIELAAPRLRALTAWVKAPGDGLLLFGPTGTGKTWTAAALTRFLIEAGRSVLWRSAAEFFRELRDSYDQDRSERAVLTAYASAPILVLDDLGAGSGSDFERRCAVELVERRTNQLLPTVVTTNWTLGEIAERLDDRLASRLSAFVRLEFGGPDFRLASSGGARSCPPPAVKDSYGKNQ